jgi:hypothetical protein
MWTKQGVRDLNGAGPKKKPYGADRKDRRLEGQHSPV